MAHPPARGGGGMPVPQAMAKAWRPYDRAGSAADLGGVSVYWHDNVTKEPGIGGELMSSTLVSGAPDDVIAALTHPCSPTGLLGPAQQSCVLREGDGWQDLFILLQPAPSSAAALLCAPRAAVVRLERQQRPDGIHLLSFSSLPAHEAARLLSRRAGRAGGGAWGLALAEVSGGYSVAGLDGSGRQEGCGGECMLTGIFRVDLGGWLAGCRPSGAGGRGLGGLRAAVAAGFVEPMLAAVPLAKKEVETGRVLV
ncbi:hypothetical protein MNEG_9720 [Monoraphidium neglectum]|uniref:START domain-containing protein n=1 Tax=Monoraphidium neglectum TaxID=145388 RepID=A0A0D2MV65_9CHLO|nr:hypothetical protein MNEG_9720 [Monoraphidium neglectum]KIY98240.1 hypothetical protein MNEG_9720 [Monoraphidium neglectum]|eukprot:XP_013897260.1 hypothetical protein MNEG_9720 [Monoraphidium neglectum]